jgi:hypothetical protein
MLIRVLVYLAVLVIMFAAGNDIHSKSIKNTASDMVLQSQVIMLDNALVNYYKNHATVPNVSSGIALKPYMENEGIKSFDADWSRFSYKYVAANKYTLTTTLNNGASWASPKSGVALPTIKYDD